jgi:hypothetical protein
MNLNVIIPVHEFNEKVSEYLTRALISVEKQEGINVIPKTIIVYSKSIEEEIKKYVKESSFKSTIDLVANDGKTDYQSQVNLAVNNVDSDYFTVLEFDDEFSNTYFRNVKKHIEYYKDVDVFLTLMIETNDKNEGIKFTNDTVWSQQFVGENGEMGYLNLTSIKQYTDFKLSGAVIKKSEFINLGKYKTNIKLTFMYEFLLRALNNACKVFSIPKIGYKHLATREGSLFDFYGKNMDVNERRFWFETANKESNFITDRIIDESRMKPQLIS